MRLPKYTVIILVTLIGLLAYGQSRRPAKKEGPDTQFLDLIDLESDQARKLALLEQFETMFPNSESLGWVSEQLYSVHRQAANWDKVLTLGEKVLALDPDNLEIAQQTWKAAESKNDPALIKLWAERTQQVAQRVISSPKPADPALAQIWESRVSLARQFTTNAEYVLYKQAFDAQDPKKKIEILDQLIQRYPATSYRSQIDLVYFLAYKQLGEKTKALNAAERLLEKDSSYPDVLLYAADTYFRQETRSDKVVAYSERLIALMSAKPAPPGVSPAEWTRQKDLYRASAYFMTGRVHMTAQKWAAADGALRHAMPLLRDNEQMKAAALSTLGWVNYKMGNFAEAMGFYKQCIAIKSPYQLQAAQNLASIESEQEPKKEE